MKLILIISTLSLLVIANWQDGYYGNLDPMDGSDEDSVMIGLYGTSRGDEYYQMVVEHPDKLSESYGSITVKIPRDFIKYDFISNFPLDLEKQYWDRRWRIAMASYYRFTDDDSPGLSTYDASKMKCSVCFDVEDEDGVVEEGTDGIGSCVYVDYDAMEVNMDMNYFGSVEALGSDSFKFNEVSENDWDRDQSGFLGDSTNLEFMGNGQITYFVSNPLNINAKKGNLGISKGETYWQCFIGEHEAPNGEKPEDFEISLADFSTDIPRRIDTSAIEDNARELFFSLIGVISLMMIV